MLTSILLVANLVLSLLLVLVVGYLYRLIGVVGAAAYLSYVFLEDNYGEDFITQGKTKEEK